MKAAVLRETKQALTIEDVQISKPGPREVLIRTAAAGASPRRMVMIDDSVKNLQPAHDLGMTTVWAIGKAEWSGPDAGEGAPFIHHATGDLAAFLAQLTPSGGA